MLWDGVRVRLRRKRCRGSRILCPCRCGDYGFVSRHKPAEHRFPDVSATPGIKFSAGRRVLSERRCGVTVCLQSRRSNLSSYVSSFGSDFCSPSHRWFHGHCRLHKGLRSPVGDCLPLLRGFTVDNKSVEALRRNGGPTPLGDGRRVSSSPEMNFRHQQSGQLHRHVAVSRKFPPSPTLRGTPSQYKRRNSGSVSVSSQHASRRTTGNSKHSHRFQSTGAAFIDFPVVVQHKVPTIQTVQKSGEVSQCQHLDRYRRARREAETGPNHPDNPEDGREDTDPSAQRHVPIIQKLQKIAETPQVVQRECRSSGDTTGTVVDDAEDPQVPEDGCVRDRSL